MENGTNFFDPAGGSDPILYQHLLWFFGHPEIYGVLVKCVLLVIGFVWGVRALLRRGRYGWLVAFLTMSLGVLAWNVIAVQFAYNSYESGLQPSGWVVRPPFVVSNLLSLVVPVAALLAFRKQISKNLVGSLFLISLAVFLAAGTLMGAMLSRSGVDTALHDTYYVIAHMQYVAILALMFAAFSLFYFGFRKLFGVNYNRWLGGAQWFSWMLGTSLIFFPQNFMGLKGMPQRYSGASEFVDHWQVLTKFGSFVVLSSLALFVLVVIEAVRRRLHQTQFSEN